MWRKRVIDWDAHLNRERNYESWASKTLHFHGKQWLEEQRAHHSVGQWGSLLFGRTGTRAMPGIVHKRWHDGIESAIAIERA